MPFVAYSICASAFHVLHCVYLLYEHMDTTRQLIMTKPLPGWNTTINAQPRVCSRSCLLTDLLRRAAKPKQPFFAVGVCLA